MTPCILFAGRARGGRSLEYGRVTRKGKTISAHRAAWIDAHGEPPPGWQVDHKCETKLCVNLDHLQAVSPLEHGRLSSLRQTRCKRAGHSLADAFISGGKRTCRACKQEDNRLRYAA